MKFAHSLHRPSLRACDCERRLCNDSGETAQKVTEVVVGAPMDIAQWLGQQAEGAAIGIFSGLRKAWGDAINDEQKEAVNSVVLFSRSAPPQLVNAVDKYMKEKGINDPKTVKALTDLGSWMQIMTQPDIFQKDSGQFNLTMAVANPSILQSAPAALFLSLEPAARQELYVSLMQKLIPERYRQVMPTEPQGNTEIQESGYVPMEVASGKAVQLVAGGPALGVNPGDVLENNLVRITRADSQHIIIEAKEVQTKGGAAQLFIDNAPQKITIANVEKILDEGSKIVIPNIPKDAKAKKEDTIVMDAVGGQVTLKFEANGAALAPMGAGDKFPLKFNRDASGNIEVYAQDVDEDTYANFSINGVPHLILVREMRTNKPLQADFRGEDSPEFQRQQRIMQLVLGIKQPTESGVSAEEVAAARASLLQTYPPRDDQKNTPGLTQLEMQQVLTVKLVQDYKEAVQYIGKDLPVGLTSQPSALAARLPACTFKGALNLGVIDQTTLNALGKRLEDVKRDREAVVVQSSKNWNERTQESRRQYEQEVKTLRDTWNEMPGYVRLAAIAGLVYSAWTYRKGALALGAAYVVTSLVTKDSNLLDTMDKRVSKFAKKVTDKNDEVLKRMGFEGQKSTNMDQTSQHLDVLANFLSETDRGDLGKQAEGLLYLSTVPLNELARNFDVSADGRCTLSAGPDGQIQRVIRKNLQARGLRTDIGSFFEDERCKADVNDAMIHTFFTVVRRENPADPRIVAVTTALEKLGAGTSYAQLRIKDPVAYRTLIDVVIAGKRIALKNSVSLGDFIRGTVK